MKSKNRTFEEKLKVTIRTEVGRGPAGGEPPKDASPKEAKIKESHAKVEQFQAALRVHEEEIKQWLAADSSRIISLRENPNVTMTMLAEHLGIQIPDLAGIIDDATTEVDFDISVSTGDLPLGSGLLQKVWAYISKNAQHTAAFRKDPEAVVRRVANSHNASVQETESVVRAVLIASKKPSKSMSPVGILDSLDRMVDRSVLMQGPRLKLKVRR
jgi:hypothetical protein